MGNSVTKRELGQGHAEKEKDLKKKKSLKVDTVLSITAQNNLSFVHILYSISRTPDIDFERFLSYTFLDLC